MFFDRFRGRSGAFSSVLGYNARHWRRQPLRLAAISVAVVLGTIADVLAPFYSGRLVDAVASGSAEQAGATEAALGAFVALALAGLASLTLRLTAFTLIIDLTLRMMREVLSEGFARVQRFSTDWHANTFAGSTVRKLTRGIWAIDLLNDTIWVALLPSAVMLVGTSALLAWQWPLMGLAVGFGSVVYIAVTVGLSLFYVAPAARLANAMDTRLGGALADAVSCNGVVKAFGAEAREENRLAAVAGKWQARMRRGWNRGNRNSGAQMAMVVTMRIGIVALALAYWAAGEASAGDVAYVLTAFFMLQGYLREVGNHVRNLQRSVNDMEELVALAGHPIGVVDREGAGDLAVPRGEIRFENVTFHYGAHMAPLYRNFSLTVGAGERVGLVGHSGSGKTTFVKLVQRLHDVTAGRVTIDGTDIASVAQSALRAKIAIVQQEPILFHRTLAENIAYARPGAPQEEIERAARLAGAHDFIQRLPKGYGTLVGERGVKLSGGERQRVAIARAFLADAPILILDEATASLDSESERIIQQAMERLMEGRTTIVIAHRLSTVRSMDRLLVFDRGTVAEEGDHASLVARPNGIYRRLFERQALDLVAGMAPGTVQAIA